MRHVFWLPGGGLGHLTRARAVMHTLRLEQVEWITASPFAPDPRVRGAAALTDVPLAVRDDRASLRRWLIDTLRQRPDATWWLDAFPGGVLGEACGLPDEARPARLCHIARRLRWDRYRARLDGALPRFDRVLAVEPLRPEQRVALGPIEPLALDDPPASAALALDPATWLVVHAGPPSEQAELVAYARERADLQGRSPPIALLAPPGPPVGAISRRAWSVPAWPLFTQVERVFTAGGFNAVRQARRHARRHHAMPFARPLDDQAWRLAQPSTGGSAEA